MKMSERFTDMFIRKSPLPTTWTGLKLLTSFFIKFRRVNYQQWLLIYETPKIIQKSVETNLNIWPYDAIDC